jgi:hypothetical protein
VWIKVINARSCRWVLDLEMVNGHNPSPAAYLVNL